MSSRSATVLVIFIVACLAFCLASVFASMTGTISILPNESDTGVLDNLSAITDSDNNDYNSYGYDDSKDYSSSYSQDDSSDDDSQVETTSVETTTSSSSSQSSSSHVETTVDPSSQSESQSDSSNVETTRDES